VLLVSGRDGGAIRVFQSELDRVAERDRLGQQGSGQEEKYQQ
jgi:hypothetical protein